MLYKLPVFSGSVPQLNLLRGPQLISVFCFRRPSNLSTLPFLHCAADCSCHSLFLLFRFLACNSFLKAFWLVSFAFSSHSMSTYLNSTFVNLLLILSHLSSGRPQCSSLLSSLIRKATVFFVIPAGKTKLLCILLSLLLVATHIPASSQVTITAHSLLFGISLNYRNRWPSFLFYGKDH